jgi:flagellar biosynthesis component FlhA
MGTLSGIATTEPAFGLPAVWIDEGPQRNVWLVSRCFLSGRVCPAY